MNIEQIKQDRKNGISVCNATWNKLIEAALLMEQSLKEIEAGVPNSELGAYRAFASNTLFMVKGI